MITRFLILLNVLAFVWEVSATHGAVLSGNLLSGTALDRYMLAPDDVLLYHQNYRIATAAFLHASIMHIALNMLSLFWLGRFIEAALGPVKMLVLYAAATIASGIAVVLFSAPNVPTLGASGAIFGLFGALFAIGLKLGERGKDLVRSNVGILVINLIFSFTFPGISWQAHVGGLIMGFLVTLALYWPPRPVYARVIDPQSGAQYESALELPDDQQRY